MLDRLKLQFDFYKNDTIAGLKIALLLFLIFYGIRSIPVWTDKLRAKPLTQNTFGIITQIEPNQHIKERLEGGKVVIKGYTIQYDYFIDNQVFHSENYIDKLTLNISQKAKIRNLKAGDTLMVKYNPDNSKTSKLLIEKYAH